MFIIVNGKYIGDTNNAYAISGGGRMFCFLLKIKYDE